MFKQFRASKIQSGHDNGGGMHHAGSRDAAANTSYETWPVSWFLWGEVVDNFRISLSADCTCALVDLVLVHISITKASGLLFNSAAFFLRFPQVPMSMFGSSPELQPSPHDSRTSLAIVQVSYCQAVFHPISQVLLPISFTVRAPFSHFANQFCSQSTSFSLVSVPS